MELNEDEIIGDELIQVVATRHQLVDVPEELYDRWEGLLSLHELQPVQLQVGDERSALLECEGEAADAEGGSKAFAELRAHPLRPPHA